MPGMGMFFVGILLVAAFCVCLVPFVVVGLWPYARRRPLAWCMAAIPIAVLGAMCLMQMAEIHRGERMVKAAGDGDLQTVRDLLDQGVSPDASEMDGYTAIHSAIDGKHWEVVRLLVLKGAHNSDAGDDGNYEDSVVGRLEQSGHRGWAAIVRKRGPP